MKKIYIVTNGIYSDYSIDSVFSNKKLAQKYVEMYKDTISDLRVEVFNLNCYKQIVNDGYFPYWIDMEKNGNVIAVKENEYPTEPDITCLNYKKHLYINVFARSKTHAIKIANEKRIGWLLSNG